MPRTPDLAAMRATLEQLPPHEGVVFRGCEARSHQRWAGRAHVIERLLSAARHEHEVFFLPGKFAGDIA